MRRLALEAKMLKYCPICDKKLNRNIKNKFEYFKYYKCNKCVADIQIIKISPVFYSVHKNIYYSNMYPIYCWNNNYKSFYYYYDKELLIVFNNHAIKINCIFIKDCLKFIKKYYQNSVFL